MRREYPDLLGKERGGGDEFAGVGYLHNLLSRAVGSGLVINGTVSFTVNTSALAHWLVHSYKREGMISSAA